VAIGIEQGAGSREQGGREEGSMLRPSHTHPWATAQQPGSREQRSISSHGDGYAFAQVKNAGEHKAESIEEKQGEEKTKDKGPMTMRK
jgi:hypothetical protein